MAWLACASNGAYELRIDRIDSIFVTGTSVDNFLYAPTKTTPLKIPGIGD